MTFTCQYFLLEVKVKFTRKANGHLMTLTEIGRHLIECISRHKLMKGSAEPNNCSLFADSVKFH